MIDDGGGDESGEMEKVKAALRESPSVDAVFADGHCRYCGRRGCLWCRAAAALTLLEGVKP